MQLNKIHTHVCLERKVSERCRAQLDKQNERERERWRERKGGSGKAVRQAESEWASERARTGSCSAVIGLRQTRREEQISALTFRAPLPPTAPWDHSKRPVNLPAPVTLLFLTRFSFSPLSSEQRAALHLDRPLIHITPSVLTGPLSPAGEGETQRLKAGREGRKWGTRRERGKGRRHSRPLNEWRKKKGKGWNGEGIQRLCCAARSIVLAFRSAQFEWQAVTDQLPAKASWQAGVTGQEGI